LHIPQQPHSGLLYGDFIREVIRRRGVRCYLEIGVQQGLNLARIEVDAAVGIDPGFQLSVDPTAGKRVLHLFRMTSDDYFGSGEAKIIAQTYGGIDFAFLDGMHWFEYLLRDIYNVEAFMSSSSGIIALHDCLPFNAEMIERIDDYDKRSPGPHRAAWTGDVWKVVAILQKYRPDLSIHLVDSEPTGLVCLGRLNPQSSVLRDTYSEIVSEFEALPNTAESLNQFYAAQTLVPAAEFLQNLDRTTG
jgi:hypothetical protein